MFQRGSFLYVCEHCGELLIPLDMADHDDRHYVVPPMMRPEQHPCNIKQPGCLQKLTVDEYLSHYQFRERR